MIKFKNNIVNCIRCGDYSLDGGPYPNREGTVWYLHCGNPFCSHWTGATGKHKEQVIENWNRKNSYVIR